MATEIIERTTPEEEEVARKVPLAKLLRDLQAAGQELGREEARFLVDAYYLLQDDRKRSASQVRTLVESEEPTSILAWFTDQNRRLENEVRNELAKWAVRQPVAVWAMTIPGIGPVLSAGLSAHLDITKAPTVGHIWRFAGLDPTVTWKKKTKRPWNASLKVLCWKIGESFVKVSNSDADYYGHVYAERKLLETERNLRKEFADQAAHALASKDYRKDSDAYGHYIKGFLPPAHIHARAKRYAVKLFLSHWHHVAYEIEFGVPPPKPYIIEKGGHTHFLAPPHWET